MTDKKNPYQLKFWYLLSPEERSFVVHKCYNSGVLSDEEVAPFLTTDRLNTISTWVLPLGFFPAGYVALKTLMPDLKGRVRSSTFALISAAATLPFFITWKRVNPFRTKLTEQKEELLELINRRVGSNYLLNSNEMIPWSWTEFEIHRKTRVLYNSRRSLLTGILYPGEHKKGLLMTPDPLERPSLRKITL